MKNCFHVSKLVLFLSLHVLLLIASCDECDGTLCATGPPSFSVELVDHETGENVFTSRRYVEADITLSSADDQTASISFIAENDVNVIGIALPSIAGDKELILSIANKVIIPISLHVREGTMKCCTNYFAEDIHISEFPFELVEESGVFRIGI